MTKVLIWGASGHARVVADAVGLSGTHEVAGFLDDVSGGAPQEFCGRPVWTSAERLWELRGAGASHAVVAVGDCAVRSRLAELLVAAGFSLVTVVHPSAVVARDASVGPGSVLCAGSVVVSGARLGANAIVNTCASVDHDCQLGDAVHIAPGARLAGRVTVGEKTWIGVGAVVRDRITIGPGTLVGAGAVVVSDLPANVVAYGVPARVVRENSSREV